MAVGARCFAGYFMAHMGARDDQGRLDGSGPHVASVEKF